MKKLVSWLAEIIPLVVFFAAYKYYGIITATYSIIIASFISILINYAVNKIVKTHSIFTLVLLTIFGGLTIYTKNSEFIKLKPTVMYLLFAIILIIGVITDRDMLKYILGETIKMSNQNWWRLSIRFSIFFAILAVLNEIIWRNFDESLWVAFKAYGLLPLTTLFIFSQVPFLSRNQIEH